MKSERQLPHPPKAKNEETSEKSCAGCHSTSGSARPQPLLLIRLPLALSVTSHSLVRLSSAGHVPVLNNQTALGAASKNMRWCRLGAIRGQGGPEGVSNFVGSWVRFLNSLFCCERFGYKLVRGGVLAPSTEAIKILQAPLGPVSAVPHCSLSVWVGGGPEGGEGGGGDTQAPAMALPL